MEPDLKLTILDLETAFWNAIRHKGGATAAGLCGDTVVATNAQGVMTVSSAKMGTMTAKGASTLDRFSFSEVNVTSPSPDVAVIGYFVEQSVTRDGRSKTYSAAECSTWVHDRDGWRCHAHCESGLQQVA